MSLGVPTTEQGLLVEGIDEAIGLAIEEAVKAGIFVRAGRLNPGYATIYMTLARHHSEAAAAYLRQAMNRLGVEARPDRRAA